MPGVPIKNAFQLARREILIFSFLLMVLCGYSTFSKYIINRGSRSTRRITSRSSVALVIFRLDSQQVEAQSLFDQVSSALCAFEVEVVSHIRAIGKALDEEEAAAIHNQYVPFPLGRYLTLE